MAEPKPEPLKRAATFAPSSSSTGPAASVASRQRLPSRQHSGHNGSISPRRGADGRRSSMLSFSSIDEVTQSLSDDIINPATRRANGMRDDVEVTHWHSTPLAFAILPAVGGVLFKNGSAFITDILLLGLAAVFMNWSVRLPWDWYYSAQAQLRSDGSDYDDVADEMMKDETAVESASSNETSPKQSPQRTPIPEQESTSDDTILRKGAATELRRQELLALLATFVFPVLAAYLLHTIRAQLSKSSTVLVSDFNLTIFVLAAEIRPCQQLIRLVSSRTLYLQRIVTDVNDPFERAKPGDMEAVEARVATVEAKLAEQAAALPTGAIAQKTEVADLIAAEIKKRCDQRFEALERAMRRYEKRSTTLNMLTEQRLNAHENRIQDSFSLAAVAAEHSKHRGIVHTAMESASNLFTLPLRLAWMVMMWPSHVMNAMYTRLRTVLLGPPRAKPVKRSGAGPGSGREEKIKERGLARKAVR